MSDAQGAHARIYRITVTADESDDTILITAVDFFRGRQSLDAAEGFSVPIVAGAAAANAEVEFGTVVAPPSVIQIASTFQA